MISMINTLLKINDSVKNNLQDFILSEEEKYNNEIKHTAEKISGNQKVKIVLLAGPSGSGKTTTAHLLCDYLKRLGKMSQVISLDDFYLSSKDAPLLPDGRKDTESVNALDVPLLEKCMKELISQGKTDMPVFDFTKSERSEQIKSIDITDGSIVVVEGLHALNPQITEHIGKENILKIYISVSKGIYDEKGEKILSSRQIRLMRRALRDEVFRNSDIKRTLHFWTGVVEAEEKYLYDYKPLADITLTTLHAYEVGVYKERFLEMAKQVDKTCENYDYFMKTAIAAEMFLPVPSSAVPHSSLINEFIGLKK